MNVLTVVVTNNELSSTQCRKVGTMIEWAALAVFFAQMSAQIPPIFRTVRVARKNIVFDTITHDP